MSAPQVIDTRTPINKPIREHQRPDLDADFFDDRLDTATNPVPGPSTPEIAANELKLLQYEIQALGAVLRNSSLLFRPNMSSYTNLRRVRVRM
jgi:hypothetical protein